MTCCSKKRRSDETVSLRLKLIIELCTVRQRSVSLRFVSRTARLPIELGTMLRESSRQRGN